jgi:peptidyl-prolyl cis-trans isomerase D
MRNWTRGWIAYVLLFLLTVAFAIWGVNDMFGGVGSQYVAEVAGRNVTPAQLGRELELTLRAERNNGSNVTQQEAIDQGLHERLLDGLISRNALYAYALSRNVDVSDRMVADAIRDIPAVTNQVTGTFDENAYNAFLQQLNYTPREFESDLRGDLTRGMLLQALAAGVRPPSSYGALFYSYEAETRVVSIAEAPLSAVPAPAAPTQEQLQQYWEESQDRLRVPEFRALTLVIARPQDFAARVNIPAERLQDELAARQAALTVPEKRTFVRVTAQNEAQANDIAARLGRGETAAAIGQALSVPALQSEEQARSEVADTQVAEAVFAMQRGQTRVVRGALSPWVVVRVDAVTAPQTPDLNEIRDELRQAIALDEASEMLTEAVGAFEDARAGGATVEAAARQHGLRIVSIPAVEAGGRDANGVPIEELAGAEDMLQTAFATPEGEASDFLPIGDADVVISVDRITPSRVRPLDEVREQLSASWIARERATRLRELAQTMISAVRDGQSFAAAARANRFNVVVSSQEINRRMAAQIPARGLSAQIFAGAEGATVSDVQADGLAILVAQVERINRVDPAAAPQQVEAIRAQLQENVTESFADALQADIVERANPRRNQRLLSATFRRSNEGEEDGQ